MKLRTTILAAGVATLLQGAGVRGDLPPIIPREVLFGNPDKASPKISPDGKRLAYLAPDQGVLNVWIRTIGEKDDHPVTKDRNRGIRSYSWADNNTHVLYIQDKGGDENWHVYAPARRERPSVQRRRAGRHPHHHALRRGELSLRPDGRAARDRPCALRERLAARLALAAGGRGARHEPA